MKIAELKEENLDHWVARANGYSEGKLWTQKKDDTKLEAWIGRNSHGFPKVHYKPSTDASQGMEIIVRDRISIRQYTDERFGKIIIACMEEREQPVAGEALLPGAGWWSGSTPLEAAMRCKVASVYGIEVPDEVMQ